MNFSSLGLNYPPKEDTYAEEVLVEAPIMGILQIGVLVFAKHFLEEVLVGLLMRGRSPVGATPVAAFTVKTPAFEGEQLQFTDQSQNATSWNWFFGDGEFSSQKNPIHGYDLEDIYTVMLIVASIYGCEDTAFMNVEITKRTELFVPAVFTPNADGVNDIVYVRGEGVLNMEFKIYNQWGIKIFETTSQSDGWDGTYSGKAQPEGNYVYILDADTEDEQEIYQQGVVTLIR